MIDLILQLICQWQKERGYQCIALDEEGVEDDLRAYLKHKLYIPN